LFFQIICGVSSAEFIQSGEKKINQDTRICSFDIVNMYTDTPTDIVIDIKQKLYKNKRHIQTTREIILIIATILDQNYFVHNNQLFQQDEGLPMGAPTSAILSQIFLQHLEHKDTLSILSKHHLDSYNRYVDDILIIYNNTRTNTEEVLVEFNMIYKKPSICNGMRK
jgi:hypothetical protein